MGTPETHLSEESKSLLYTNCMQMVNELQDKSTQIMEIYKNNPTFPFDFYTVSLREADTKIQTVRELYKRMTNEALV
jgi:hypothetical protein